MLYISPDPEYIISTIMGRFYTIDEINPNLKLLSDNYQQIVEEFKENKDKLTWTNWKGNNNYDTVRSNPYDGWEVASLFIEADDYVLDHLQYYKSVYNTEVYIDEEYKIAYSDNAKLLPTLRNIACESGLRQRVGISVVHPGKQIDWHVDNDPKDEECITIRGLWGLEVNSNDDEYALLALNTQRGMLSEHFENNKFMFFWGSTTHMVYNTLTTPRYCLCFDQKVNINELI